nr:MAG TPA: hypothetical protein [Caudoviricetes sp.]
MNKIWDIYYWVPLMAYEYIGILNLNNLTLYSYR